MPSTVRNDQAAPLRRSRVSAETEGEAAARLSPVTDCIFCRIVAGEAPAFVVAEDDRSLAFLDRAQATEGHTLVVPRTHATDI